jgi:hypothetical protein
MASKADEFRTKAEEYRDLAESATKPYAIESIGGGWLNTGWRWLQPKTLQRIGNSSPSRVTAAAQAKGRTPKWLEMKIPGPHTRSTKATSSEALTRRVLKPGGGNSNSKRAGEPPRTASSCPNRGQQRRFGDVTGRPIEPRTGEPLRRSGWRRHGSARLERMTKRCARAASQVP